MTAAADRALVVGGSSDIGAAVAQALAGLGQRPVLWGRDPDRLRAAAEACGGEARVVDVTVPDEVRRAVAALDGPGPLRTVVWAAGEFDWAPADEADPAVWQRVLDVGLTAAATLVPQVLPLLLRAAPSALVLLGSGASRTAYPGNAAHVAVKHGLAGLAGSVWQDVRDRDVKVSLVSPGLVAAGAGLRAPADPRHLLQPADVAEAVRWVVTAPVHACPVEVTLQPQRTPAPATR